MPGPKLQSDRKLTGYVIELTEDAEFDPRRIRPIISVHEGSVAMESQLIALAGWMRKNYGSTMNQALKTVLPIRRQTKEVQKREIVLLIPKTEAQQKLGTSIGGLAVCAAVAVGFMVLWMHGIV